METGHEKRSAENAENEAFGLAERYAELEHYMKYYGDELGSASAVDREGLRKIRKQIEELGFRLEHDEDGNWTAITEAEYQNMQAENEKQQPHPRSKL